jgi:hypothetical protein
VRPQKTVELHPSKTDCPRCRSTKQMSPTRLKQIGQDGTSRHRKATESHSPRTDRPRCVSKKQMSPIRRKHIGPSAPPGTDKLHPCETDWPMREGRHCLHSGSV